MTKKTRNIEVLSTNITYLPESQNRPSFVQILQFLNGKEYRYVEKIFEFKLMRTQIQNCYLGIIITIQDKDIPPKRNKITKEFHPVDIDIATEGLGFANVFLYDELRNVLLYEVNRNGCFIPQLQDFIYSKWNTDHEVDRFSISFPSIFKINEYQKMLRMSYYKTIIIELLNPRELVQCFNEETDSLANNIIKHNIVAGVENNANSITIKQTVFKKRLNPLGLSATLVQDLVDVVKSRIADRGRRFDIQTLKVEGYFDDVELGKSLKPIDLLGDTFKESFKIEDIEVQSDVQELERKEGIEAVYHRILPEIRNIIGR